MACETPPIGFLGAGNMATALARGWLAAGLTTPAWAMASDPLQGARQRFTEQTGIRSTPSNGEVVEASEVLVLAVKPQSMTELLAEMRPALKRRHLLISVAAGITLRQLADGVGQGVRLARVIPNTPCLVGASASGYSLGPDTDAGDAALVDRLCNAVGKAFLLPEALLDAVTGLSASGPAFVYV